MVRARRNVFATSNTQHFVVIWDLQWRIIDCVRPQHGSDLRGAFEGTIERLGRDGWTAECGAEFGFTFVIRKHERRLVMITARDPFDATAQSFSPFDPAGP
jgi:hypothetical protein